MTELKSIRAATADDLAQIGQIADVTGLFPAEYLDDMIAGYFDGSKPDIWFVYEQGGAVISFGFCEPERMTEGTWNLLAIGVLPANQGSGVGTVMMQFIERRLAEQGERVLLVETMSGPELAATRKFYQKIGYIEEARIREFYEAGADKIIYWKHL